MSKKKRGGRPAVDPSLVRRHTIGVRVSDAERNAIAERATQMGMSAGEFLRSAALARKLPRPPVAQVNRDEYAKLGRLSGNLNQLVAQSYQNNVVVSDNLVKELLAETHQLRLALLGVGHDR